MVGTVLGGLGLFLLGMHLLTDTLKELAGDTLRAIIHRSTKTVIHGTMFGAAATAVLQSSSAVTLVALGFVSAGLLPFRRALGVVYGANLGTTATAWIIAVVGLKIPLDTYAMPFVGVGALLGMMGKGKLSSAGLALAGFGLIFVGIDTLQTGLASWSEFVDPAQFTRPGFLGVLLLVAVGAAMTVVLQSSSAAVATTLAAVHAGTLSFEQAAALAIGQNVGTTVKALLGSAGGQTAARRVALGHIVFNVVTGLIALVLLQPFVAIVLWLSNRFGVHDPAVSLAIFHTAFNVVGVAVFIPLTPRLADWIERVTPPKHVGLTHRLNASAAATATADVRLEIGRVTLLDLTREAIRRAAARHDPKATSPQALRAALQQLRDWLAPLQQDRTTPQQFLQHLSMLDAIDHLERFVARLAQSPGKVADRVEIDRWLALLEERLRGHPNADLSTLIEATEGLQHRIQQARVGALEHNAQGSRDVRETTGVLDGLRWCEALAQHGLGLASHLRDADYFDPPKEPEVAPEPSASPEA